MPFDRLRENQRTGKERDDRNHVINRRQKGRAGTLYHRKQDDRGDAGRANDTRNPEELL